MKRLKMICEGNMKYTGERFIPQNKAQSIMSLEHYHRYIYASQYCTNKRVLDIACGSGYGSSLLSEVAKSVVGVDIDENAIQWCKQSYNKKNLMFEVNSIDAINYPEKSFDIITCFETIEHVSSDQQKKAIELFGKILEDDGLFFCSTPSTTSPLHIEDNKYHVHELSEDEFYTLLSSHFKYVRIIGQSVCLCSTIGDFKDSNGSVHTTNKCRTGDCKYLIGICSNSDITYIKTSSVYIETSSNILRKLTKIRNKLGWAIPIYNIGIQMLSKICPFKKFKQRIENLKW